MPEPGGMTVRTKAIELRVEGVRRTAEIAGRHSRPGCEFVIVDTSWKNIIPLTPIDKTAQASNPTAGFGGFGTSKRPPPDPANIVMAPTPYVVPMLAKQMWLLSDGRFADTVDLDAQPLVEGHFPLDGFGIQKLDDVVRGTLVFEARVGASYQAFQFYDNDHGHALVPLVGSPPPQAPPTLGPARENELLHLSVTEAGPAPGGITAPEGQRALVVGLRGSSRSPRDIIDIPVQQFIYAQTEQGCLSRPEPNPEGLARPIAEIASFPPTGANEGQLLFFVPASARAVRVLLRSEKGAPLDLPAPTDFQPTWPKPVQTITDGTTLRVHLLPAPGPPPNLPPLAAGRAYELLDVVAENLNPTKGVELQSVQLRLQAADGSFIDPSPLSSGVPCRLSSDGVIPAATARRFLFVYETPGDQRPRKVNYRGFELQETTVGLP